MDTFSGLPAHPLFVHAPIVLVPLLTLLAVAVAVRGAWRPRGVMLLVVGNFIAMVMTVLSTRSGEYLSERLKLQKAVSQHEALGENARLLMLVFLLLSGAFLFAAKRASLPRRAVTIAGALTVVAGVLATIWMFRTGHSGAEVLWNGWDN